MPETNLQPSESQDGVIDAPRLRRITGYKSDGHLRRYLEEQGIAYFPSPEGPWTTTELVKIAGMTKIGIHVPKTNTSGEGSKYI